MQKKSKSNEEKPDEDSLAHEFEEYLIGKLRDPDAAQAYLEIALSEFEEDGNYAAFLQALNDVTKAQGGVGKLAQRTHLKRQSIYRVFSGQANPRLDTLASIIHALGYRLTVEPLNGA